MQPTDVIFLGQREVGKPTEKAIWRVCGWDWEMGWGEWKRKQIKNSTLGNHFQVILLMRKIENKRLNGSTLRKLTFFPKKCFE